MNHLQSVDFSKSTKQPKTWSAKGLLYGIVVDPQMNECMRKKYRQEHGTPPSDDMMPSGKMIAVVK